MCGRAKDVYMMVLRVGVNLHTHTHTHMQVDPCRSIYAGRVMRVDPCTSMETHTHTQTRVKHHLRCDLR